MKVLVLFLVIFIGILSCTPKASLEDKGATKEVAPLNKMDTALNEYKKAAMNLGYLPPDEFKARLKEYNEASDETKKIDLAFEINLAYVNYQAFKSMRDEQPPKLSSKELKTISDVKLQLNQLDKNLEKFEKDLSSAELAEIANGVEYSLVPIRKTILYRSIRDKCREDELAQAIKKHPEIKWDRYQVGRVMAYSALAEDMNIIKYKDPYLKVIEKLNEPQKTHIRHFLMKKMDSIQNAGHSAIGGNHERMQRISGDLEKAGVKNVKKFVFEMTKLAPSCLSELKPSTLDVADKVLGTEKKSKER